MLATKKPLIFKDILTALKTRGRDKEAEHYRKMVTDRFMGTFTGEEIETLPFDDIVTILQVAKSVKELCYSKNALLQAYVADLQSRGFTVSLGEKYR